MVQYVCDRCHYSTKLKGNFSTHLKRKNTCHTVYSNITIYDIASKYNINITQKNKKQTSSKILQNTPIKPKNSSKILQNTPILCEDTSIKCESETSILCENETSILCEDTSIKCENTLIKKQTKGKYICTYCNKSFTRSDNYNRHLNHRCKLKKQNNTEVELINKIENLLKEKEKMEVKIIENNKINISNTNENSNNTDNSISNNNIIINNYGNENMSYITHEYMQNIITSINSAIPKLIEYIHFNPEYPENKNIKISNKKLPYAQIMKNGKWHLLKKNNIILELICDKFDMIEEFYEEILNKIPETKREEINMFITNFSKSSKDLIDHLKEKSELTILNNR